MRRWWVGLGVVAALVAVQSASAGGGHHDVTVEAGGVDAFAPTSVSAEVLVDNEIRWTWGLAGTTVREHNVRQVDRLFRSGDPTSSRPTFTVAPSAGKYRYYCEVHGGPGSGMSGIVKVSPHLDVIDDDTFQVDWLNTSTPESGDHFDVRYRVDDGPIKLWLENTKRGGAKFGKNDKPVDVKPNRDYTIQVRSKSSEKRRSGWSPAVIGTVGP